MSTIDSRRKQIIISEIDFWKQNNMLPEHYCDYLLALYTEGENIRITAAPIKKRSKELFFNSFFLLIILITLTITYFTDLSFFLQTVILAIFAVFLFFSFLYYRRHGKKRLLLYITGAFLLLIFSVRVNETFFASDVKGLYFMLFINCFIWIIGGIWRRVHFFTIAGLAAVVLLLFFVFKF